MRRIGLAAKVVAEWVLALLLASALLPLLVALACLVKLSSPGPVLYVDERVGLGGRTFRMFKFRSMFLGVQPIVTDDDKVIVQPGDRRLTPVGRFLRLGFDELPQLLNVLRGEMALIGPRPDAPWMLPKYTEEIRPRLQVRPGITGLAQVLRGRDLPTQDNYAIDTWYVTHWTPLIDLRIAALTPLYIGGWRNVGQRWLAVLLPDVAAALPTDGDHRP